MTSIANCAVPTCPKANAKAQQQRLYGDADPAVFPLARTSSVISRARCRRRRSPVRANQAGHDPARGDGLFRRAAAAEVNSGVAAAQRKPLRSSWNRRRNFEVGTATIVDTHEAQSRYDLATAQEIAADSELEIKRRALEVIVGRDPGQLAMVREKVEL